MTFEQLLVFHKIVQAGSFKAAANELHKTQPAISFSIKKLEEEMEVELFDRSSYRPTLTSHGKAFYERSHKIMQGMSELESMSKSFQQKEEPEIGISVDGICMHPGLLRLFKTFGEQHPFTKLNMNLDILSEAERKVLDRETQIGITHFLSDRLSVEIVPFATVTMVPVMNRELYLERKVKHQKDLLEIDQVVIGDKNPKGSSFGLLDNGKKWRLLDNNFKREIIMAGLGWGHLPQETILQELKEKKIVILDFEDIHPRKLDINLIRLKKQHLGPIAKKLWEELISFQH
ncbi:MAG: LysR family transcriptional regulator [Bdellovibrionales bacterium]|nr:LysR family transcriptional regulator [Bdellovibrionales bacterium]